MYMYFPEDLILKMYYLIARNGKINIVRLISKLEYENVT
jgi:hypothetical protein